MPRSICGLGHIRTGEIELDIHKSYWEVDIGISRIWDGRFWNWMVELIIDFMGTGEGEKVTEMCMHGRWLAKC